MDHQMNFYTNHRQHLIDTRRQRLVVAVEAAPCIKMKAFTNQMDLGTLHQPPDTYRIPQHRIKIWHIPVMLASTSTTACHQRLDIWTLKLFR